MTHQKNAINYERTFCDLSPAEVEDFEREARLWGRASISTTFNWATLLKSSRILIVSEAGAGKTYECREQCKMLWAQGEPAFYLELSELARTNLSEMLSSQQESRLAEWKASPSAIATFFLDSIDELKLTQGFFETALKRLGKALEGQLDRARIVITSRPIAIDQQLIKEYLPVPAQQSDGTQTFADIATGQHRKKSQQAPDAAVPAWRNVSLMPLSNEQICEFARIKGVENPEALLADILARNAEQFARRPQDLLELCADWREHKKIRRNRDQVAQNVLVKLKPRPKGEATSLSPEKAFEGASRLALASLLTRKLTIRLGIECDKGGEAGASLRPELVLPDWSQEEITTLLERSLFGFATYGRVRFHHRSVLEYLAAERLIALLGKGMPIRAVKRLLFATTPQAMRIVRPSLRPVAAWVAATTASIFAEVRDCEPTVLLEYADPQSLTIAQRVDALRAYVSTYGQGGWRGMDIPQVQVQRFASAELSHEVSNLWNTDIENPEVRELLLELVGAGPLQDCADLAFNAANNASFTERVRLTAISALANINDARVAQLVQSIVSDPAWSPALVRGAVARLFPRFMSAKNLCAILNSIPAPTPHSVGDIEWIVPRNLEDSDVKPDYLEQLRFGLEDLVTSGAKLDTSHWPPMVSSRAHLLPMLAAVCLKLLCAGHAEVPVLRSIAIALRLKSDDYVPDEYLSALRKKIADLGAPEREVLFWADDAFCESLTSETDSWARMVRTLRYGPLDLDVSKDRDWVMRTISDSASPKLEREMMLQAALFMFKGNSGYPHDFIEKLRQIVADEPSLLDIISHSLAPAPIDPKAAAMELEFENNQLAQKQRLAQNLADWTDFAKQVSENPDAAFAPDRQKDTVLNLLHVMALANDRNTNPSWDRRFIEKHFNKSIADRLRQAMLPMWREVRPLFGYERPPEERNTILRQWQTGLAAIYAEAEDPNWAKYLSEEEAAMATRYAALHLNSFPAWLEAVMHVHPFAVEQTLGPAIVADLDEITQNSYGLLLQYLRSSSQAVIQPFLPRLRVWLDACANKDIEPTNAALSIPKVQRVIEMLIKHGTDDDRSQVLALARRKMSEVRVDGLTPTWLTTLLNLLPDTGVDALELLLNRYTPAADGFPIDIFGGLFGDRTSDQSVRLRSEGFTPTLLSRLVRLAYKYVRPTDDPVREGTYTPDARDHAQTARSVLLNAIIDAKGLEAWQVKIEMVNDPLFSHFRDRLAALAREKSAEESDESSIGEADMALFDKYGEIPPATRDELFAIMVDRLDDLEDMLLQDDSPREIWEKIPDEKLMRRAIAGQLQATANHMYTIDQEGVTADEKETDIRLRVAASEIQGVIELKVAEKSWSGRDLRDTILEQLVTKYMAPEQRRAGCLMITVATNRNWEHPDTGKTLDIDSLRTMLKLEAARVMEQMGGKVKVEIRVLDLRPRLPRGANGTKP
jgi:hypothetical protein